MANNIRITFESVNSLEKDGTTLKNTNFTTVIEVDEISARTCAFNNPEDAEDTLLKTGKEGLEEFIRLELSEHEYDLILPCLNSGIIEYYDEIVEIE